MSLMIAHTFSTNVQACLRVCVHVPLRIFDLFSVCDSSDLSSGPMKQGDIISTNFVIFLLGTYMAGKK